MLGYKSAEEYFKEASPDKVLDKARIPVFCLNAADDPLVPFDSELVVSDINDVAVELVYLNRNK